CALSCKHCNHTYLNDMQNLTEPDKLLNSCRRFADEGDVGFLLSGGCDKNGAMLNLRKLLPIVKQIKKETDLVVKLHTGLVDKELAEDIVAAGVDIASVEVVGSNETIQEIFDFNATVDSYANTLQNLEAAGMPYIVPHVCIGLHYGELNGEFHALEVIKNFCDPSLLVLIIFRPTKGTILEQCKIPSADDVSTVVEKAKELFPDKDVSLGCIRPRAKFREEIELAALKAGVTRMEIPSKNTLRCASEMGYSIKKIHACCALPKELEKVAILNI
ncbi:MAG: radical SAM protein, partial [Candidatus Thermoplasmatota archaeon]|nr:radical SAM protein [Candidatus Thermoplasmatota archaeon]